MLLFFFFDRALFYYENLSKKGIRMKHLFNANYYTYTLLK